VTIELDGMLWNRFPWRSHRLGGIRSYPERLRFTPWVGLPYHMFVRWLSYRNAVAGRDVGGLHAGAELQLVEDVAELGAHRVREANSRSAASRLVRP
jgi:hypothetical protein